MTRIQGCRGCGSPDFEVVLDLGSTPLANSLRTREQIEHGVEERRYPLRLVWCPRCTLLQIDETVSPDELFRDYLYFSSFSDTMVRHAERLVTEIVGELSLGVEDLVIEVASNDGYLLQFYKRAGTQVLGIEPAENVADVARTERGIDTISEFFDERLARELAATGRRASVIHAHNVLAHVADLHGVLAGFAELLRSDGIAVIEFPYVHDMLEKTEFDTIYHEHLCYFSLTAIVHLFELHGLRVTDVARIPIHGGTLRVVGTRANSSNEPTPAVAELLAEEERWGVGSRAAYERFAQRVGQLRTELMSLLHDLKARGASIAAYGAAAKGSTLLNTFGIGRGTLDFVADRSTYKQGLFMPGVDIPIYAPERLLDEQPDYALLLTWNFADEILEQQAEYRERGGRFIVPVPQPTVLAP